MVEASDKTGKYLMIDQNQRLAKAKTLIAHGIIGKIFWTRRTWNMEHKRNIKHMVDKKRASMWAMADMGVHKTDLIQYLVGSKVVEITEVLATLDKKYSNGGLIGVDDVACFSEQTSGQAVKTLWPLP